jgi:hypothetical protein
MAPDLPPRALPAAWRLLQANEDNHTDPCDFDHHGDCQAAGHSWCGETAHELRRECGVRCLTELVPRVIEAEQHAEAHRTGAAGPVDAQATLADLWSALRADESGVLAYALQQATSATWLTERMAAQRHAEAIVHASRQAGQ